MSLDFVSLGCLQGLSEEVSRRCYQQGAVFPPVIVFYDGTSYWLADGFHRVGATESLGRTAIVKMDDRTKQAIATFLSNVETMTDTQLKVMVGTLARRCPPES